MPRRINGVAVLSSSRQRSFHLDSGRMIPMQYAQRERTVKVAIPQFHIPPGGRRDGNDAAGTLGADSSASGRRAVESLAKEHRAQLLNYLRLTGSRLGLLVNFCAYPKAVIEQWAN